MKTKPFDDSKKKRLTPKEMKQLELEAQYEYIGISYKEINNDLNNFYREVKEVNKRLWGDAHRDIEFVDEASEVK